MQIFDARGNEFTGQLDLITGQTMTDARAVGATLGALNAEAIIDLNGQATAVFNMRTGAMAATFVFEGTVDGTNYDVLLPALDLATETYVSSVVVTTTLTKVYAIDVAGMRRVRVRVSAWTSGSIVAALRATNADYNIYAKPIPTTLAQSATAAANTGLTLTLPAAGAGLYHYITAVEIVRNATAALLGTATLVLTSTNLPGSLAWSVGNAMAAGGTQADVSRDFAQPLKSLVANTASTLVLPAPGAAVLWRANVYYYVGA